MAKTARVAGPLKILFIGNSFTARNDLPGMITRLAASVGKSVEHRLIFAGGASLRAHWNSGAARQAIAEGGYDYVVLQEQSTLPIKNAKRMHENVRLFDELITAAGSKTVLYLTWARANAPESQQTITEAYMSIGKESGATVVPVGVAWERFLRDHSTPVLHDRDQSHPSVAGSYLAACVFLAALFKGRPRKALGDVAGLDPKYEVDLQDAAWRTYESMAKGKT
jgi:hypothetical protein